MNQDQVTEPREQGEHENNSDVLPWPSFFARCVHNIETGRYSFDSEPGKRPTTFRSAAGWTFAISNSGNG